MALTLWERCPNHSMPSTEWRSLHTSVNIIRLAVPKSAFKSAFTISQKFGIIEPYRKAVVSAISQ